MRCIAAFTCAVMLTCFGFAFAEPSPNRAFFVRWANSGSNKPLRGAHFVDARTGWAVGEGGTIVATRDGGTSWSAQVSGTDKALFGVHFADARTGWAVGEGPRQPTIVRSKRKLSFAFREPSVSLAGCRAGCHEPPSCVSHGAHP